MSDRRQEIAAGLAAVRERIAAGCAQAGRDASDVRLVVVTKFFPASDVRLLADLGVTDLAENRHQEAEEKAAECADLPLTWHFIGGLQSNKAAAVARYARRGPLGRPAQAGRAPQQGSTRALAPGRRTPAGEPRPSRHRPALRRRPGRDLDALADAVEEAGMLRLRGLMAVAPLGEDPQAAFARLAGSGPGSSSRGPTRTGCPRG